MYACSTADEHPQTSIKVVRIDLGAVQTCASWAMPPESSERANLLRSPYGYDLLDLTTILCGDIAIRQSRGCRLTQCTPHVRRLDDEVH
jgi:hypothetical protein